VFLGVLGNDVLKIDLSNVDPRRLARGEWEEVVYVGILLVRVAKGVGMLEADNFNIIDLESDATSSRIDSEEHSRSSISLPVSLMPSPPLVRAPHNKPGRSTAHTTSLSSPPPLLHSAIKMPSRRGRPRPPEKESTPPSSNRKPSYMTYRPLASPPKPTQTQQAEISICSCTFEEDLTTSTVHCHCEIHGSDAGQSDLDTSVDDHRINWNKGSLPVNILAVSSSLELTRLSDG
jgi:hypothetical protein